jgi:hypothetical protein
MPRVLEWLSPIIIAWRSARQHPLGSQSSPPASLARRFFFYMLWFGLYAALSAVVAKKSSHLRRLLNPVTNGMVVV